MQLVQQGTLRHAGLLFERYQKPIYGYFMKVLNNYADAEDATQITFSRLLKYRQSYSIQRKFSSWLFSIAVNQGNSVLGKRLKEQDQQVVEVDTRHSSELSEMSNMGELVEQTNGSDLLIASQTKEAINEAIISLPQAPRELLSLYLCQERDYSELANIFEVKAGTIRVRVHRALALLQRQLTQLGSETYAQ